MNNADKDHTKKWSLMNKEVRRVDHASNVDRVTRSMFHKLLSSQMQLGDLRFPLCASNIVRVASYDFESRGHDNFAFAASLLGEARSSREFFAWFFMGPVPKRGYWKYFLDAVFSSPVLTVTEKRKILLKAQSELADQETVNKILSHLKALFTEGVKNQLHFVQSFTETVLQIDDNDALSVDEKRYRIFLEHVKCYTVSSSLVESLSTADPTDPRLTGLRDVQASSERSIREGWLELRNYATAYMDSLFRTPLFSSEYDENKHFESLSMVILIEQVLQLVFTPSYDSGLDWFDERIEVKERLIRFCVSFGVPLPAGVAQI